MYLSPGSCMPLALFSPSINRGVMAKNSGKERSKLAPGIKTCGIGGSSFTDPSPKGRSARLAAHRKTAKEKGGCPLKGTAGHTCPTKM